MATSVQSPPRDAPPELPPAAERSSRYKFRRGLALIGMSLVIPGSAQLAAGNKRVGRIALRVWLIVLAAVVLVAVLALLARGFVIAAYANGITPMVLAVIGIPLGLGWLLLVLDAVRLARPREMGTKRGSIFGAIALVLAALMAFGTFAGANILRAQADLFGSVLSGGGNVQQQAGRYNILLLGGDAGPDRTGLRPDSMTVASIDAKTGRTVLFGLPRNLEHAPFPTSSPLHKLYPNGYWCSTHECLLNAVYTLATEHKNLYPGVKYPGVQATKEVIEEILGLKINYFGMVDMQGFVKLIDAVGGITISTTLKVPIGGGTSKVSGYIGPGKNMHLDGYHALWFARSREGASDYARMARQKCVMNAMLKQLNPVTVFTKFNEIAQAGKEIVATDVPSTEIGTLLDLAAKGKDLPIASVSFSPPTIWPGRPDYAKIRTITEQKIAESEALDEPKASQPPATTKAPATAKATAKASTSTSGQTDDLSSVCQAG